VARLLATAALWVRIQLCVKNTKWATKANEWPTHPSPPKKYTKSNSYMNYNGLRGRKVPESIEWFIGTRLFRRRMIWLLPLPLPPFPSANCLSFLVFRERGKGAEREAKSYDKTEKRFIIKRIISKNDVSNCYIKNLAFFPLMSKTRYRQCVRQVPASLFCYTFIHKSARSVWTFKRKLGWRILFHAL
jgi:hypothetical protein